MSTHKGFTLIEVVVSIAILGLGLLMIIELFSGGLRLGRSITEYTKAMQYAKIKLEELRIKPPEEGIKEGSFDESIRWKIEVKKVDILSSIIEEAKVPSKLLKIDLIIFWRSGINEKSIKLETYRTIKENEEKT